MCGTEKNAEYVVHKAGIGCLYKHNNSLLRKTSFILGEMQYAPVCWWPAYNASARKLSSLKLLNNSSNLRRNCCTTLFFQQQADLIAWCNWTLEPFYQSLYCLMALTHRHALCGNCFTSSQRAIRVHFYSNPSSHGPTSGFCRRWPKPPQIGHSLLFFSQIRSPASALARRGVRFSRSFYGAQLVAVSPDKGIGAQIVTAWTWHTIPRDQSTFTVTGVVCDMGLTASHVSTLGGKYT